MTTIIDTPDGIEHFRIAQLIARLKIEINTGMNSRISTLIVIKQTYPDFKKNTKKAALDYMLKLYKEMYGHDYGSKEQ